MADTDKPDSNNPSAPEPDADKPQKARLDADKPVAAPPEPGARDAAGPADARQDDSVDRPRARSTAGVESKPVRARKKSATAAKTATRKKTSTRKESATAAKTATRKKTSTRKESATAVKTATRKKTSTRKKTATRPPRTGETGARVGATTGSAAAPTAAPRTSHSAGISTAFSGWSGLAAASSVDWTDRLVQWAPLIMLLLLGLIPHEDETARGVSPAAAPASSSLSVPASPLKPPAPQVISEPGVAAPAASAGNALGAAFDEVAAGRREVEPPAAAAAPVPSPWMPATSELPLPSAPLGGAPPPALPGSGTTAINPWAPRAGELAPGSGSAWSVAPPPAVPAWPSYPVQPASPQDGLPPIPGVAPPGWQGSAVDGGAPAAAPAQ